MDYSKTVNLPESDFPMRANLPKREPALLEQWAKDDIYNKILDSRSDVDSYILHDGPPYANGHLHTGHALNKILKDIIVKHKTMMGFKAPYVPGWDCHGLPIELNVTKQLGKEAESLSRDQIRKKCRVYADKFVNIQMDEFKRLGVFGDYEHPYKTMTPDYEAKIVEVFGEIFEKGYIYRSKKPIYWCPTCVTALAEAEVEYDDHRSPSVYVKFKVDPSSISFDFPARDKLSVVIWTTTPWTLPANLAVCFHPNFQYGAYRFGDDYYILAQDLVQQFEEAVDQKSSEEILLKKEDIEKLIVAHPFIDRESKVILGGHVTLEQGTGIVHTAPGHGHEDYIVGIEYGLDVYSPVDDYGKFTDEFSEMEGVNVFDANEKLIALLKDKGALIKVEEIEHSYPHCWRCKKPLIFRATEQWFLKIDHDDMRKRGIAAVADTEWIPSWGEARFLSMVESRPDWCLSRQRSWGVPIPSFRCESCEKNLMSPESVRFFSEIARTRGIDTWFTDDIKDLIPQGTQCECGSTDFVKEYDILDVWFDSGVSHFVVLDSWKDHRWPADLYLEGSDQHRGWFQSSLWPALATRGKPPYRTVLTHGFVLDEAGKAMSKSQGNVIPPEKIIKQYGADILRLWVSSEDYRNDVRIGMQMMQQVADSYRRIRNTFKFIIGNLSDFEDPHCVPYKDFSDIDRWILHRLFVLSTAVIEHYEKFEFHSVYRKIVNFCAVELSSIYFDISKDILYIEKKDSLRRRANQTVLKEIYNVLTRLIAPILSFTSEEVWKFTKNTGSVHFERYYQLKPEYNNPEIDTKIGDLVNVKKDILKALELLRKDKIIRSSLEAEIELYVTSGPIRTLIEEMGDELKRFLQVARVTIVSEKKDSMTEYDYSAVAAKKTDGKKCVRCWNYSDTLGSDPEHPELCERCTEIVASL